MTDAQFEKFASRLFAAFPDVYEWVHSASPDAMETQEIWRDVLRPCRFDECLHVLDDWINGRRKLFENFERGRLAHVIRQSVYFDRDKEAKRNGTDDIAGEYKKVRRSEYKPLAMGLTGVREAFEKGKELKEKLIKGEISEDEFERRKKEVIDSIG